MNIDADRLTRIGASLQQAMGPLQAILSAEGLGELSEAEAVRAAVPVFRQCIPAFYESAALMASMANELDRVCREVEAAP